MAAFPVQPAALRANTHRRIEGSDPRWQRIEEPAIGQRQPCVADLDETPIASQQNAPFGMRLFDEIAVTAATFGDRRALAGDA